MTGLITNYINAGVAASRPASPSVTSGSFGLYYATDTGVASIYAGGSWNPITASAVAWGSITGTLSAQSDLNTALSGKVSTATSVTAGTGLSGGGALSGSVTLNLANTAVTPGSYTLASITVDAQGRITAASNGSSTSGTVTTSGTPASGNLAKFSGSTAITNGDLSGDVTTSGTLVTTLANTAVTPASYTYTSLTVDSKGRITAASNGTTPLVPSNNLSDVSSAATSRSNLGANRRIFMMQISGTALASSEILLAITPVGDETLTFAGNMSGSTGIKMTGGTNPGSTFTGNINKNNSAVGTWVISTSGVVSFTTTSGASISVAPGDLLEFVGPSTVSTALGFTFTLKATASF